MGFRNPIVIADEIVSGSFAGSYTIDGSFTIGNPATSHVVIGSDTHGANGVRLYGNDGVTPLIDLSIGSPSVAGSVVSGAVANATNAVSATSATTAATASSVPAAGITAGTVATGVTVPGGNVSGAVASATTATSATSATTATNLAGGGTAAGSTAITGSLVVGNAATSHVVVGTDVHGADGVRLYGSDGVTPLIDLTIAGTPTITGALVRTAATGARIEMGQTGANETLKWYTGDAGEANNGYVATGVDAGYWDFAPVSPSVGTGGDVIDMLVQTGSWSGSNAVLASLQLGSGSRDLNRGSRAALSASTRDGFHSPTAVVDGDYPAFNVGLDVNMINSGGPLGTLLVNMTLNSENVQGFSHQGANRIFIFDHSSGTLGAMSYDGVNLTAQKHRTNGSGGEFDIVNRSNAADYWAAYSQSGNYQLWKSSDRWTLDPSGNVTQTGQLSGVTVLNVAGSPGYGSSAAFFQNSSGAAVIQVGDGTRWSYVGTATSSGDWTTGTAPGDMVLRSSNGRVFVVGALSATGATSTGALTTTGAHTYASIGTRSTSVTGGSAQALPSAPVGYMGITINGVSRVVPYYS